MPGRSTFVRTRAPCYVRGSDMAIGSMTCLFVGVVFVCLPFSHHADGEGFFSLHVGTFFCHGNIPSEGTRPRRCAIDVINGSEKWSVCRRGLTGVLATARSCVRGLRRESGVVETVALLEATSGKEHGEFFVSFVMPSGFRGRPPNPGA